MRAQDGREARAASGDVAAGGSAWEAGAGCKARGYGRWMIHNLPRTKVGERGLAYSAPCVQEHRRRKPARQAAQGSPHACRSLHKHLQSSTPGPPSEPSPRSPSPPAGQLVPAGARAGGPAGAVAAHVPLRGGGAVAAVPAGGGAARGGGPRLQAVQARGGEEVAGAQQGGTGSGRGSTYGDKGRLLARRLDGAHHRCSVGGM